MSSIASKRKVKKPAATTSKRRPRATGRPSGGSAGEKGSGNVFRDLGLSEEESRLETLKADIYVQMLRVVRERELSQRDLCAIWGKPQSRVSELLGGKLNLVSLDTLVTYLTQLGIEVTLKVKKAS